MMNDDTQYEVYREIYLITAMRDGAVFKTRHLRDDWVPWGAHGDPAQGLIYAVISDPDRQKNPRRKKVA